MTRYVALIDGKPGAYGVVIPDLPGMTAMGKTIDEALANAAEALRDWVAVIEEDGGTVPEPRPAEVLARDPEVRKAIRAFAMLASVPLVQESGRPAKANLSLDSGILEAIDAEARRRNLTRSALIEAMAKTALVRS